MRLLLLVSDDGRGRCGSGARERRACPRCFEDVRFDQRLKTRWTWT